MKKLLRIIGIVLVSLAALLILMFLCGTLFGGCAARNYVNNHGEDLLGRKVNVDGVGVNLFTGHVKVKGLTVYEDDGESTFAGFDTLDVGMSLLRMLGKMVYVRHITLAGLDLEVLHDGNRFNFSSIIEHFQQDSTEVDEPEDTVPSSWVVSLHDMHIVRGKLNYTDVQRQSHWGMNDLNLAVPDFTIGGRENTDAGLELAFDDGGRLRVKAAMNPANNYFDVTVGLEGFALDQVRPYVVNVAHVDQLCGHLDVEAQAMGMLDSLMDMNLNVKANLNGVELSDKELGTVAKLHHLGIDAQQIVPGKNMYDINQIEIEGLKMRYELFTDSTNTLSRLLAGQPVADSVAAVGNEPTADTVQPAPAAAPSPLRLRVGVLDVKGVDFTFVDNTLPDKFEFPVTDLNLKATNLTTAGNNNARMLATLPNGGKAIVDWEGNISDWKLNQRLRLSIKNFRLTELNPYMVAYFGMPFSEGVFSFTSLNTIRSSQLKGNNRIDIFKPNLGEKREDVKPQLHLPLRAALYILKDKDEKVMLPVPVSGNIDNPKFNYMKLVWKTLGNLIVKVVTSPARAFDSLAVDDQGNMFIAVDPKEHDFTSEQFYQIDKVANLAKMDENVVLTLTLATRPGASDKEAENHERRNKILRHHLKELGVSEKQFTITAAPPDKKVKQEGYIVEIKN
jgi:hypothetical protein